MPDWKEITKRLKERSQSGGKETPYEEGWSEKEARLEKEDQQRDEQRKHNPGLYKIQKKIVTDDIFGLKKAWEKIKEMKNKLSKSNILIIFLLPALMCSCSVNYGKRVDPNGISSTFYNGAVGGKGGAVQGDGKDGFYHAAFYDNEKSFRDGVIGLVTYGVADVIGGVVKAGQAADTAQHAATTAAGVENAKTAAGVTNTATKADLLKAIPPEGGLQAAPITFP